MQIITSELVTQVMKTYIVTKSQLDQHHLRRPYETQIQVITTNLHIN